MPPLPKKKHSRARRAGRAAHFRIRRPSFAECQNCGSPKLPHRMCRACGYYKGREVISVEAEIE
jgi:large subunit ribosomal protein L32